MEANHPTIYIYGDSPKGNSPGDAKVRIAYGRERKDAERVQDADWVCKLASTSPRTGGYTLMLYSAISTTLLLDCDVFAVRASNLVSLETPAQPLALTWLDVIATGKASNVGDNDAAPDNVPSQFLLLRGLEPTVSEELLAKGVGKLNKPTGSVAQSVPQAQKKGKVASTTGDANLGAKEGTLRRILLIRDRKTNESWRYGFAEYATIEDAQAALTRYNSFDRFTIASKQVLVSYIHAGVFVPVHNSTAATERFTFSPLGNQSIKLQYWDEEAYVTELIVNALENNEATSKQPITNPAESEGLKQILDTDKSKKRKPQPEPSNSSSKKATPSHLRFWSNRHAELHGINQKSDKPNSHASDNVPVAPTCSYADASRNCCYLCMRQFNSVAQVNQHERLSDLHQKNLKDEAKVKRAEHKLEKHGITAVTHVSSPSTTDANAAATSEYRDRAKERRKIYGVVNKKGEQVGSNPTDTKERSPSPPPVQTSKGASLLSKMGYTTGSGLGASGTGMTAPISQDVYVAGVGLGAEGGKIGDAVEQAEKNTKSDYGDFVRDSREKARERYRNM